LTARSAERGTRRRACESRPCGVLLFGRWKCMRTPSKKVLAVLAVSAATLGLLLPAGPASADAGPSSSDIVGVGSDTLQYMLDFGADGDASGDAGYNPHQVSRLVSIDATPDANARSGYLNGSTSAALL